MKKGITILVGLILFCVGIGDLHAYTYTYINRTGYLMKVNIQLYDDTDQVGNLKAHESHAISTGFLLKSWSAEVFLDDKWQQVLNLTCDFLPGNHTFSIHVKEVRGQDGKVNRDWYAVDGGQTNDEK